VRTTKFSWLTIIILIFCGIGWAANLWANRNGYPVPVLHLSSLLTMLFIVVFTLVLGIRVLRWRNGKRDRPLDPILAARTLVLAQATAYAGALLFGWHTGIFIDQLALSSVRSTQQPTLDALAMMGGGAVMVVVGLVVERFCKLPPEDMNPADKDASTADGEGEYA
jgi:hypothetical protein